MVIENNARATLEFPTVGRELDSLSVQLPFLTEVSPTNRPDASLALSKANRFLRITNYTFDLRNDIAIATLLRPQGSETNQK
jgi:hypothetical protein